MRGNFHNCVQLPARMLLTVEQGVNEAPAGTQQQHRTTLFAISLFHPPKTDLFPLLGTSSLFQIDPVSLPRAKTFVISPSMPNFQNIFL